MVADDLSGDHGDHFALRGIHLPWHDAAARLVLWQAELAEARARAGAQEAQIVGDLVEAASDSGERPGAFHDGVVRGQGLELVRCRCEGPARLFRNDLGDGLSVAFLCVQPGADGCAAEREGVQRRQARLHTADALLHLGRVPRELLPQGQGCRILAVRAPDLDDVLESLCLLTQGSVELLEAGDETLVDFVHSGDVHGRREAVVAALPHVHVVVRVHRLLRAEGLALQLVRAVRDDLVHVHVRLRARARLEDD
mmetsp:Transcript_83303/g.254686  ORF Transcript_83303/g.254686 Transcript_83303/m.254686 type:complete len:254 (+) Transcript_83303:581-1342(+)